MRRELSCRKRRLGAMHATAREAHTQAPHRILTRNTVPMCTAAPQASQPPHRMHPPRKRRNGRPSRQCARRITADLARIRQRRAAQAEEITLHPCPRWPTRTCRARRHRLPHGHGLDARRPARRHRVLRAVGLPDHQSIAHRMGLHGHHRPAAVLATARETPIPGHRLRHHSHRRALHVVRPQPAHEAARGHVGGALLGDQLVVHPARRILLRRPRRPEPWSRISGRSPSRSNSTWFGPWCSSLRTSSA